MSKSKSQDSFFEKTYNPIIQAAVMLGGSVIITLLAKAMAAMGIVEIGERFPWMSAAAFMLCFAVFNSVFSLSAPSMMKYWGKSIYCFMGLAIATGLFAWFVSSLSINEAGSYKWIYFVVTIGYLVFLSMMGFMKNIVDFAQREDWSHPRLRRKGGKGTEEKKS
jgi:drug/metabolite transporter (DMT)-like permease